MTGIGGGGIPNQRRVNDVPSDHGACIDPSEVTAQDVATHTGPSPRTDDHRILDRHGIFGYSRADSNDIIRGVCGLHRSGPDDDDIPAILKILRDASSDGHRIVHGIHVQPSIISDDHRVMQYIRVCSGMCPDHHEVSDTRPSFQCPCTESCHRIASHHLTRLTPHKRAFKRHGI